MIQSDTLKTEGDMGMKNNTLPLNLQFFAEPGGAEPVPSNTQVDSQPSNQAPVAVDYDKIQKMLDGTLAAKEDTALKAYFKQQGLSQEEAEQAMASFKQQKEANKPNITALQDQAATAKKAMIRSQIENKALLMHQELGIDIGTVSYLMKLADLSGVTDQDGTINEEKLKEAFNKVLEDVPQLKKQQEQVQQGFRQVGAGQNNSQQSISDAKPVASKRWNRFN